VLLLSATPVHNAKSDLYALLGLFLGSRARQLTSIELASCIVRRTRDDVGDDSTPGRATPVWLRVDDSADTLQALLDIPAPCPPRDGGDGGALITLSLVRAWASTEAALRATLRRRIARADSLADALAAGRHPTRAELRAWVIGDDATQLAFPELIAEAIADDVRALRDAVQRHADGARRALAIVTSGGGALDDQRCALIRDIRLRHAGERVVVFSQFADSVHALFGRLRSYGRVAAVTANSAWVAGGALSRAEVLARFAPVAMGARRPARAESIDLLLATDLLSEGLNLQDASVVVHLDLPWTAARLTQRVGRVWRIGSPHARVHEYAVAPPAPADELLRLTEVLTRKAGEARAAVGESLAPLLASRAPEVPVPATTDRAHASEDLRKVLYQWRWSPDCDSVPIAALGCVDASNEASTMVAAGVRADVEGWIAVVDDGEQVRLLATRCNMPPSADPSAVLEVATAARGPSRVTSPSRVARVLREIDTHLDSERAAAEAGVADVGSRAHASAAGRIASVTAAAAPHRRVVVSRLAADARRSIDQARSAGAERLLNALVATGVREEQTGAAAEAWLEQVIELGTSAPNAGREQSDAGAPKIRALLLLIP
jgi:hypothetical protein